MTASSPTRSLADLPGRVRSRLISSILALGLGLTIAGSVPGQPPGVYYPHSADLPPGTVAGDQRVRDPSLRGYYQPVEITGPPGARISLARQGRFGESQAAPVLAGFLIGPVYRLKVTQIPRHEGREIFPTIELVNRLYPPPGRANHFPVPIQLTQQELELALAGRFVTRVIYLEDPQRALGIPDEPGQQRYFEVGTHEDPLRVADRLGRPMAILRIGSRIPDEATSSPGRVSASPPYQVLVHPGPLPEPGTGLEESAFQGASNGRQARVR